MQRLGLGLIVILIAALAGCGGGGGNSVTSSPTLMELSDDISGTWQVGNLDLPNDEITITKNGEVVIEVAEPQTLGTESSHDICIGSCSSAGVLSLNGTWTAGGIEHSINASGSIDTSSSKLSLIATVVAANETVCQNAQITGTKGSETPDTTDDIDSPPAPPSMDTEEETEAPPAPPF